MEDSVVQDEQGHLVYDPKDRFGMITEITERLRERQAAQLKNQFEGMTLEEAVFTALGAASVCWEDMSGAGVFQDGRAKQIGDDLVAFIRSHLGD